jgi:hypothetical protein
MFWAYVTVVLTICTLLFNKSLELFSSCGTEIACSLEQQFLFPPLRQLPAATVSIAKSLTTYTSYMWSHEELKFFCEWLSSLSIMFSRSSMLKHTKEFLLFLCFNNFHCTYKTCIYMYKMYICVNKCMHIWTFCLFICYEHLGYFHFFVM